MAVWWRETWQSIAVDLTVENQPTNNQQPTSNTLLDHLQSQKIGAPGKTMRGVLHRKVDKKTNVAYFVQS